MRSVARSSLAAAVALLILPTLAPAQPAPLEGLDDYVTEAMAAWEVPGLALAVVEDDSVVYARGYGTRRRGRDAPVDANTLFAIGSSSKAFTSASLAMLSGEGKVSWDDPVHRLLPGLELHDPYVTREITVRDLLSHTSGLPRCDRVWYGTSFTREEILHRVRFCDPERSFRSRFGYQNIMFLAAGRVVARLTGERWDRFVEERIFAPLGMERSSTSVDSLRGMSNVASPHAEVGDTVRAIEWRDIDNIGPAGSVNSSVAEMAQWIRLQLGEGSYEGERLIPAAAVREMHTPQTLIRREAPWDRTFPESHLLAYGLGWFLHDYRDRMVVEHGGAIDGMRAQVTLVPEEELGLVVLTNMGTSTGLGTALQYRVLDAYLDAGERDWAARYLAVTDSLEAEQEKQERELREARAGDTEPSLPLAQYAGTYADSLYGEIDVRHEDGTLTMAYESFEGTLEHWHHDTFRARFRDALSAEMGLGATLFTFRLDATGRVEALEAPGMGRFGRVPEKTDGGESDEERGGRR